MKKVVLSAAALMIGAIGFAQTPPAAGGTTAATSISESNNESTITQTGLDHYAEVTQIGTDNWSEATQSGEGNYFKLKQDGIGNESTLTQSGSSTFRNNDTEVTQIGEDNVSDVDQSGTHSWARVFQRKTGAVTARNNVAEVVQVGTGTAYNDAFVSQYMEGNFSRQEQTGEGNDAWVSQQRSGNDSYQYQTGNFNSATAVQGADPYTAIGGNQSTITQNGDYGYAHHNQLNGNNNLAQTTQSNDWQHSVIDQSGDSHKAFVIQQ